MTQAPETLEEQLRRVLGEAASQLPVKSSNPWLVQSSGSPIRETDRESRGARRAWVPGLGGTVAMIAVLAAIAIGAGAIVVLGHRHPISPSAAGAGASGAHSSRQELVQTLGVLRTPQTTAARDPRLVDPTLSTPERLARRHEPVPPGLKRRLAESGNPVPDRSLIRVVQLPGLSAELGFVPASYQPSVNSPRRLEGLYVTLLGSGVDGDTGTAGMPTSLSSLRSHGLAIFNNAPNGSSAGAVVVPDGVADVQLGPFRLVDPPVPINSADIANATAHVNENVAAFDISVPMVTDRKAASGLYGVPAVAQTTWFDANGTIIRRTTTKLDVFVRIRGHAAHH
jgi:hypothetical protein